VARPVSTLWERHLDREIRRYRDGRARMPSDPRKRERQLFRIGSAAWGAGLSALMLDDARHSRSWLVRAARDYRASAELASPGAWGRFVGVLKSLVIAGDEGAVDDARWTLGADAATAESPTGRYAACLAWLVLGEDADAARLARSLAGVRFPRPVAGALGALAAGASDDFNCAVGEVLRSFETRKRFLEDIRVADTVIALQALADERNMAARPSSRLLPRHESVRRNDHGRGFRCFGGRAQQARTPDHIDCSAIAPRRPVRNGHLCRFATFAAAALPPPWRVRLGAVPQPAGAPVS
jgi:hypothetical protein